MQIKITDSVVSLRHVSYDEMGIRQCKRFIYRDPMWDHLWVYEVIDKKKFFLAVIKYGITFVHENRCPV